MRKVLLLLVFLAGKHLIGIGQVVDSIKVEQAGDFIRISYKILDSKPGQVYRVRVLCSINGGLNTELRSVSGDTGDNVQGGKPEYFVVWDVLKDVDELNSAEFIVRAELTGSPAAYSGSGKDIELTGKWTRKWFHVGPLMEAPGPRFGFIAGVMGSFGLAVSASNGKYSIEEKIAIPTTPSSVSVTLDDYLKGKKVVPLTLFLTKRIVNYNSAQVHLMIGAQRTRLVFFDSDAWSTPWHEEKLFGPAAGLTAGFGHFAMVLTASHIDPGPVEKEMDDWRALSALTYFSAALCFRF